MARKKSDKNVTPHVPIRKSVRELVVGDRIVSSVNKEGFVTSSTLVNRVVTGVSCKNLHINGTACYDRSLNVLVSVAIDQAADDAILKLEELLEDVV